MTSHFLSPLTARIGQRFPRVDEFVFNRDRNRTYPGSGRRLNPSDIPRFRARPGHVVVAALEGPGSASWGPARGNYYYEIYQSARERFGADKVSVLDVGPKGSRDWACALVDLLEQTQATHLIAHMERDPGMVDEWTWDIVWSKLASEWDGVFVGVMWDSGFDLIRMKGRRLARISPKLVGLDICVPIDNALVRGRCEVGPVPLVESDETLSLLNECLEGVRKTSDLSFIGALYPYRRELLEGLEARGIRVAINPHKSLAGDLRDERPSWLDYMSALASSEMTLNFSMASSGAHQQLKWRVVEATLAGALLLTDDTERTKEFFVPESHYGQFSTPDELASVVESWLAKPEELKRAQNSAKGISRGLARTAFWERLAVVLRQRNLPTLPTAIT